MTQIKLRRDTSANFTSANPILGNGEPAYETDTKKLKIGDGTTAYTQLEYFSAGGGSTNISATLPLKIVDGVISLEVDGQTIQIVDGKLHANLDELSNTVNTLSDDVGTSFDLINILQTDVQTNTENITNLQNTLPNKQDKLAFSAPLNQSTVGGNPYITADGSLIKFTRTSTSVLSENGTIDNGTKVYAVTNGVIDYTHNLIRVDTPDILNNKYEFFFVLKGMTTSNPRDDINTGFILANTQTNGVVTPRYYISTPIHNGTQVGITQVAYLNSMTQSSVSSDYVSYTLTQLNSGGHRWSVGQQEGFKGIRMYHNGSKYILQSFTDESRANTPEKARANGNWNNYTDYITVDLSDVNSIYMPSNFSTETETSGIDASKTVLYKNDVLTDIHFASIEKGTEQVNLNIGSGLSVVDGKLSATSGGDKVTVLSNEYTTISPAPTNGVWYKSQGNGYIVARFMSSGGNQFCQLAINATGTGSLDDNSIYNQTAFSQGNNNGFTLLLPISSTQYYAVNTNFGRGLQWARFVPFITA